MKNRILIASLAMATFTIGADEYVLGPLLTPIGNDFSVDPAKVAWLISAFALPYALLAPMFGILADRFGRKRVILPGLVAFILATVGTALASSFSMAVVSRVLTGVGAAAVMPNVFAFVGDHFREADQPRVMGYVQMGLTLGLILSPAMGAFLAEIIGWREAFWAISAVASVTTCLSLIILPSARTKAPSAPAQPSSHLYLAFRPGVLPAIGMMILGLGVAIGTYAVVGELLRARYDLSTGHIGMIMTFFGLLTVLGNLLVSPLFKLFKEAQKVICAGMVLVGLGIGTVTLAENLPYPAFLLAGAFWLIGGGFAAPALQVLIANLAPEHRGLLLALGSSGLNLGIAMMTILEGWLFASMGREIIGILAVGSITVSVWWLLRSPANSGQTSPETPEEEIA